MVTGTTSDPSPGESDGLGASDTPDQAPTPAPAAAPPRPRPWGTRAALAGALVFSGSSQAVVSAPFSWWWITPIYLVPGLWAMTRLSGWRAFLGGWLMGWAANVTIFYWIVHTVETFSNLPRPAAVGVLMLFGLAFGLYTAVFAAGLGPIRRVCGPWWPLGAAAWWVACEVLNPQLFPYYQGVGFYQVPSFFLVSSVTGVPGVSFQMVLWNTLVAWALERRGATAPAFGRPWRRVALIALAALIASVAISRHRLGTIEAAQNDARERNDLRRIALVQDNLQVADRREIRRREGPDAVLDILLERSRTALRDHPDVDALVWAEGVLPGNANDPRNAGVRALCREHDVELWTGGSSFGTRSDGTRGRFNSAFRIDGQGNVDRRYDKNILLPFGEFMPLAETFPILRRIRGVGNYIPGEHLLVYDADVARFAFLICYEAIRTEYVRQAIREEVDLLVNVTYDAWFGDTTCAAQHLMLAAVQSALYGVPLVRAATTGITAVVDPRGIITAQTDVYRPDVLVADVPRVRVPSVYAAVGDVFSWSCVAISAALVVLGGWRRWRDRARASGAEHPAAEHSNQKPHQDPPNPLAF